MTPSMLHALFDPSMRNAGTFHSVGCQIVRRYSGALGDTGRQEFAIFDQDDTKSAMKKALQQLFSKRRGPNADIAAMAVQDTKNSKAAAADKPELQEWVSLLFKGVLFLIQNIT